jgi:cytoskeletal protein RodZ
LKKYASILGVSSEEILASYEALRTMPENPPQVAPTMRMRAPAPEVGHLPRAQVAGIAMLLLAALGVFIWKPWQHHKFPPDSVLAPAPAAAASTVPPADPDHPIYAAGTSVDSSPGEPPSDAVQSESAGTLHLPAAPGAIGAPVTVGSATAKTAGEGAPVPGHGPTRLRLSFSSESWVDIHDADGRRVYSGYGRANSVKSLVGDGPLKVYLGYASGVQLEINERAVAIASAFVHGDVARFQAGADGVLRNFTTEPRPAG